MPRTCTACTHEDRAELEGTLIAGVSLRTIADRFAVSKTALIRHKDAHLPPSLLKAKEAREEARADDLLSQVRGLQSRVLAVLEVAEASGKHRTALAAIAEARRNLELLGKLAGELDQRPVVNVLVAAEWIVIRTVLLEALSPYPQASAAVAERLVELEAG